MQTDLLLERFDTLLTTPGDVARLEAAILQLAVQGKLVPQDPEDEPATELLKRILVEKGRSTCVKETPPNIEPDELPYELPRNWVWTRLEVLGRTQTGTTPTRSNSAFYGNAYPFVRPSNIVSDLLVDYPDEGLSELGIENGRLIKANSVLMVCIGSVGKVAYVDKDCSCNQQINALTPHAELDSKFIVYFMRSPYFQNEATSRAVSTTLPILNKGKWSQIPFPLPPLAEQKRIVAKVDALLAQTRALAARLEGADAALVPAAQAAFQALPDAPDATAQHAAWQRVADHFDVLTNDPRTIAALKQTILQLAVEGKLVPQNPEDEPASVLLERIEEERKRLAKASNMASRKPVSPLRSDETPYQLPKEWVWIKLDEVTEIAGGVTKGRNLSQSKTVTLPYLRVANVQRGYLDLSEVKEIQIKVAEQEKYLLKTGDLLLTEGGDADKLGRSAIWGGEISICIHQNHIFRARSYLLDFTTDWIMLCTNSEYGRDYFLGSAKQTTNLASINMTQLRNFPLALPPLAEQKRIVAKVEALLALCDALADGVVQAEEVRARVLGAVLNGQSPATNRS